MIPITPKGTRTLASFRPFGRSKVSSTSPIGSGRAATCLKPSLIPSMRAAVRRKRSCKAVLMPFACAFSRSLAFAAMMVSLFAISSSAIFSSASFFCAVVYRCISYFAAFALRHNNSNSMFSSLSKYQLSPCLPFEGKVYEGRMRYPIILSRNRVLQTPLRYDPFLRHIRHADIATEAAHHSTHRCG